MKKVVIIVIAIVVAILIPVLVFSLSTATVTDINGQSHTDVARNEVFFEHSDEFRVEERHAVGGFTRNGQFRYSFLLVLESEDYRITIVVDGDTFTALDYDSVVNGRLVATLVDAIDGRESYDFYIGVENYSVEGVAKITP